MSALTRKHLDSVVAIERADGEDDEGNQKFAPIGSGVLVGRPVPSEELEKEPPKGSEALYVYLVTNWHVIDGHDEVFAKMNVGGAAQRFALRSTDEEGAPLWFSHGDFDIAVTYIEAKVLREEEAEILVVPEKFWLTTDQMGQEGMGPGDLVFACGFPMGLSGTLRKFSIVRNGAIARLDDEILAQDSFFLLDCSVFPGNSGGPVFTRPDAGSDTPPCLVGVVSGYLPYEDVAISAQTGKPRVTFEENSGLASVVPVEAIIGACDACAAFGGSEEGDSEGSEIKENRGGGESSARLIPGPVDP